ncbi:MAG: hypothetical protein WD971_06755 [Pirellulales bacterium]
MNDFVLPDPIASQLQGFPHVVSLCDASGKKIGTFVPTIDLSQYEIVGPEPSEEELREAEQSIEWYSTQEVLRHLENLP